MITLEAGKFAPGSICYDDSQIMGKDPGKIAKLSVWYKAFIFGIQITYTDGSTSGFHGGFMEPEVQATLQELTLAPDEYISQIFGYASDFIGVLRIKTTSNNEMIVGKMPAGSIFEIKSEGRFIHNLSFGCSGYVSYIRATFRQASEYSKPPPYAFPVMPGYAMPSYSPIPPVSPVPAPAPSATKTVLNTEYTALCGKHQPGETPFNDYETLVGSALAAGSKVRISNFKVFYNDKEILGIETTYEIFDREGKTTQKVLTHKSSKVGMFTSTCKSKFTPDVYITHIQGKSLDFINKLKVVNNKKNVVIDCGTGEGSEFLLLPTHNGPIIAFAGTINENLTTLRAYSTY